MPQPGETPAQPQRATLAQSSTLAAEFPKTGSAMKKSAKNMAVYGNIPTFAMRNILKGGKVRKSLWAFFMPMRNTWFHAPVPSVNATAAFEVLRNGSAWNRSFNIHASQNF